MSDAPIPGAARGAALPPPVAETNRPLAAAGFMVLALLNFSAMAVAGREAQAELDTFELLMWRSLAGLVIVLVVLRISGGLATLRFRRLGLHTARNVVHFAGQNLWFHAVTLIPLAQLFAYEFTSPLWVALLAPLLLGERFVRTRLLAAGLGFVGILIVARPWSAGADFGEGQVAALGAAVFFAATVLSTKSLARTESAASILVLMTGMQFLFGLATAGWDLEIAVPDATLGWVAAVAVTGLAAHWSATMALSLAPASVVAPMEFARLPMIAVVGWLVYAEALEAAVLIGAAVVFAGNLINLRAERRRAAA